MLASNKICTVKKALFTLLLLCNTTSASALFFPEKFPVHGIVASKVEFWQKIFSYYDSMTMLVHDSYRVDLVLDIIDFRKSKYASNLTWQQRQKYAQKYVKRYRKALRRFKTYKLKARKFGKIEQRIYAIYRNDLSLILAGKAKLRSQTGLRDTFIEAIKRAKQFMPHMEEIFAQHKLPKELVRLTFVESMFNHRARSKVGAAGVWQFMPNTAREFLHLNSLVDERISPLKATKAAAKLLRRNYRKLKTYPLAITAYNQGVGNIHRAVKELNTRDIDVIIRKYQGKSFGFAGRNFYSEFMATNRVYRMLQNGKVKAKPVSLVSLRLPKRVSTARLIKKTSLDKSILGKYNPCFSSKAFTSKKNVNLPPYYEIYVPRQLAAKIKNEVRRI